MNILLWITVLITVKFVAGARRRSIKGKVREELVETIYSTLEFYTENFHINDQIARNIYEGALLVSSEPGVYPERDKKLLEFFETPGVGNISRVSAMQGFTMAAIPGLVEKYIYSNDLKTVLKKAFGLVFDEQFKKSTPKQQEEKVACVIINCTERFHLVEHTNLASEFVEVILPVIRDHLELFDQNNIKDTEFFDLALDLAVGNPMPISEKAEALGKLYEETISLEARKKSARELVSAFRGTFGRIERVVRRENLSEAYKKLSSLGFNIEYRDLSEEEKKKRIQNILFPQEEKTQKKGETGRKEAGLALNAMKEEFDAAETNSTVTTPLP